MAAQEGGFVSTIDARHLPRIAAFLAGFLLVASAGSADAAQLPTARPADVGLSAERLARLDTAMQIGRAHV